MVAIKNKKMRVNKDEIFEPVKDKNSYDELELQYIS